MFLSNVQLLGLSRIVLGWGRGDSFTISLASGFHSGVCDVTGAARCAGQDRAIFITS